LSEVASIPASASTPDRTWFITGSSSGIGRTLAARVLELGEHVFCTARNTDALRDLAEHFPETATILRLDVTDRESVKAAVAAAIEKAGRIDVLINNAGYGVVGALEEVEEKEVGRIFDTNVFGPYRVTAEVLPHMRARGSGHILNMSSALGVVARGGYCFYCATKFALEGMSEALAEEVAPFGIKVTILEPGSFRTSFRNNPSMHWAPPKEPYAETLAAFRRRLIETDGKQPGDPERGADAIIAVVNSPSPPLRLPMGETTVAHIEEKLYATAEELTAWRSLSLSTSFEEWEA
jgi:NAD(P)-dependent dehydrogenase (short-subunit alcohol dehydrogenase family)